MRDQQKENEQKEHQRIEDEVQIRLKQIDGDMKELQSQMADIALISAKKDKVIEQQEMEIRMMQD